MLIGLSRFPSGVVTCASALESVLKAKLSIPADSFVDLKDLIREIRISSPNLRTHSQNDLDGFRRARNRIIHYGFSPKDDAECARLLVETGLPFLKRCYKELFDFFLDWQDVKPGIERFDELNSEELAKVGLIPEIANQLRVVTDVHARAKHLRGVDFCYCLLSFGHFIRLGLKESTLSAAETATLADGDARGMTWEAEQERKSSILQLFGHITWEFDCPVCGGCGSLIAELDQHGIENKRIALKRSFCARCDLRIPREAPFLTETLLDAQLKHEKDKMIQEYGIA